MSKLRMLHESYIYMVEGQTVLLFWFGIPRMWQTIWNIPSLSWSKQMWVWCFEGVMKSMSSCSEVCVVPLGHWPIIWQESQRPVLIHVNMHIAPFLQTEQCTQSFLFLYSSIAWLISNWWNKCHCYTRYICEKFAIRWSLSFIQGAQLPQIKYKIVYIFDTVEIYQNTIDMPVPNYLYKPFWPVEVDLFWGSGIDTNVSKVPRQHRENLTIWLPFEMWRYTVKGLNVNIFFQYCQHAYKIIRRNMLMSNLQTFLSVHWLV